MVDVAAAEGAWAGAVLLHPHPSYGGDRHNVVVAALWDALPAAGAAAVRFDFDSPDVDRCVAQALDALASLPPAAPRFVVGYSFGAAVASRVVAGGVAGWALIAPPAGLGVQRPAGPTLVLVPEHDQYGPPEGLGDHEVVGGADHFLAGSTKAVAARVLAWLREVSSGGR